MASGNTNADVATRLVITESTVKSHVKNILRKLAAGNRAEAASRYMAALLRSREARLGSSAISVTNGRKSLARLIEK